MKPEAERETIMMLDGRTFSDDIDPSARFEVIRASLQGEPGARTLRLEVIDWGDQLEVIATETEPNAFRGRWGPPRESPLGSVTFNLYGDPREGCALVGEYLRDGTRGFWALELWPDE